MRELSVITYPHLRILPITSGDNPRNISPQFTRLNIRTSAAPHIRILPEACALRSHRVAGLGGHPTGPPVGGVTSTSTPALWPCAVLWPCTVCSDRPNHPTTRAFVKTCNNGHSLHAWSCLRTVVQSYIHACLQQLGCPVVRAVLRLGFRDTGETLDHQPSPHSILPESSGSSAGYHSTLLVS